MNNIYFFQIFFQEIVLTGSGFLAKVRIDGFIKRLALSLILKQV